MKVLVFVTCRSWERTLLLTHLFLIPKSCFTFYWRVYRVNLDLSLGNRLKTHFPWWWTLIGVVLTNLFHDFRVFWPKMPLLLSKCYFQTWLKVILLLFAPGLMKFAATTSGVGVVLCIMLIHQISSATMNTVVSYVSSEWFPQVTYFHAKRGCSLIRFLSSAPNLACLAMLENR